VTSHEGWSDEPTRRGARRRAPAKYRGFRAQLVRRASSLCQELERVHDLDEDREIRLLNVSEGLPPVLWFVLVSLGIDTILFTYFVGMKTAWLHALAVAALTGGIALIIFAIVVLDRPFGGDLRVGPDAFEMVLNTIEGRNR
jgi:hypothetical protein